MVGIVGGLLLMLLALADGASAQETRGLEPVVVTATRTETPAGQLGASVSVVTEDDFKTYHYPTVDEALRHVPGVEIRRSGSLGKTTGITIRGANTKQVQVLVDGVRVKSPTLGEAELANIAPELIERRLAVKGWGHVLFHGGVASDKRSALVDRFNGDPDCRVFLSTDAGGVGLNLQYAAAAIVNMDLPWNPAVLEQRIGRVHRIGQTRGVQVTNFVAQGTIEEGMLSVLAFKKSLFAGVLDGATARSSCMARACPSSWTAWKRLRKPWASASRQPKRRSPNQRVPSGMPDPARMG